MMNPFVFADRAAAGRLLARRLQDYAGREDVLVLAIPPGGAPVAREVSQGLKLALDVLLIRNLVMPGHSETPVGVVISGGGRYLNKDVIHRLNVSRSQFDVVFNAEIIELQRRQRLYAVHRGAASVGGRIVIVVDDGSTPCDTLHAAMQALRAERPASIVLALPAASHATCSRLEADVNELECVYRSPDSRTAREFYEVFDEIAEQTACELLAPKQTVDRVTPLRY
jgi:predicted phosphoribosyltransferase